MKRSPILLLLLLISITANTYAVGHPPAGRTKSESCQGCHGPDGNSVSPDWPNLASQNAKYLRKQMHDFLSGDRKDPTMSSMVIGLNETDIADIAAYFSIQVARPEADAKSAAGKKIYLGGNRYNKVPACAGCHGPSAIGNGPGAIPGLAGQKAGYTAKTLRDFKSEERANDTNSIMREIAAKMTGKEIDAVSAYLAGLGAPENMAQQ
jgi:cytochrome c553